MQKVNFAYVLRYIYLYTIKMTYILKGSDNCLKLQTGFI